MTTPETFICLAVTLVASLSCHRALAAGMPEHLPESTLTIETADGDSHRFRVRLAVSPEDRRRGLMRVTELPDDAGMLFDFGVESMVGMWMKNTPLSLDMVFITGDGRISSIAGETTPYSRRAIVSREPVLAVLEIGGGIASRLEIEAGDRVRHPLFEEPDTDADADPVSGR